MRRRFHLTQAFSLVEVTLALGVAAFCLIAVMGLLPVAAKTHRAAVQQTRANDILTAIVADFRATPKGSGNSSGQYRTLFPNNRNNPSYLYFSNEGSTGQKADHPTSETTFYAVITYMDPPAGAGSSTATLFHVKVCWPYGGDTSINPDGYVETFLSLDRN
jgi:uncharacterized protein (TIGR02598 family)